MNTIIYTRVSTQEQVDSGAGLNAQLDACRAYAKQQGWDVLGEHEDAGVSGTADLEKRTGLMTAISALSKGDVLLVAKRDRIGRDVVLVKMIERMVAKRKASIYTLNGSNDATPEGALLNGVLDLSSAYEIALIRARTKAALGAKKARGERTGSIPYGYAVDVDGKTLIENELEQKALTLIHDLNEKGLSLRNIAARLTTAGYIPRGKAWHHQTVKNILEFAA
jgi:DNA invertase Pin-like site-specific DNA recombinase